MTNRIGWLFDTAQQDLDNRIPLPKWIDFIRSIRFGLEIYDCTTVQGRCSLYIWWVLYGRYDYQAFDWHLSESDEIYLFSNAEYSVPLIMQMYVNLRPDLKEEINDAVMGADRIVVWWFGEGSDEPFVAYTIPILYRRMVAHECLPHPLPSIWRLRPDLQDAFDVINGVNVSDFLNWWKESGRKEYPKITLRTTEDTNRSHESARLDRGFGDVVGAKCQVDSQGVNVIGFAAGILGIGEDARMAASVLRQVGLDVGILQPEMLVMPKSFPELVTDEILHDERYPVSLFCLPPTEMIRLVLEGRDALIESPTYKIGAWPWELPNWPVAFDGVGNLVDEIWAPSRFVATSYSSIIASTRISMQHVPLAVDIPVPTENLRYKYALPNSSFLFYLMFDGNSWLSRKNPISGVRAFKEAFDDQCSNVGLVIKAMNIRSDQPMWVEILSMASKDKRIHIVSDTISRHEVINLMASCDAYISLHRSEGFGRIIAEAMLLGQPTITTNYSGNLDFCNIETSFLVNGEIVPVRSGEYIFPEDQHWCNPDIGQAAECLREVFEDGDKRKLMAMAGKKMIEENFSVKAVADIYSKRLIKIFEILGIC